MSHYLPSNTLPGKVTPAIRARMRELRPSMTLDDVAVYIEDEFGVALSSICVRYHTLDISGPHYRRATDLDVARAIRLLPYMPRRQIAILLGVTRETLWKHLKRAGVPVGPRFDRAHRKIAA